MLDGTESLSISCAPYIVSRSLGIAAFPSSQQRSLDKILSGEFSVVGYLWNVPAANRSLAAGLFVAIGENALSVNFVNVVVS